MRTGLFLLAGFLLLATATILGRLFSVTYEAAAQWFAIGFMVVWFCVAAVNMGLGVFKAGYAFGEELPIFLLIFAVPTIAAIAIRWKWA